jgi:uncharacterized membrane protein
MEFHPPLASFPFALISVAAGLEFYSFFRPSSGIRAAIRINLVLAAIFVGLAFLSGYSASDSANLTFIIGDDVISEHHNYGRLLLFLIFPCAALEWIAAKAKFNTGLFRLLYLLALVGCVGLVICTGYLGGKLVFEHGAGVSAKK